MIVNEKRESLPTLPEAKQALADLTVRTEVRRRMKLYGRNYPSEKRLA